MNNLQFFIKIGLTLLLFLCLLEMPYGYFQLVRFIAMIGFGVLTYHSYKQGKQTEMFVYGALLLLFQPLLKISLGRELWNIVDIMVGIGLIASLFIRKN